MISILVHGFNVWDGGRATVGRLRPFFAERGLPYVMINYGWFGIGRTYRKNKLIARQLAEACESARHADHRVVVVGHSNGAAIIYLAAKHYGARIDKAVFINPALDKDIVIPESIKALDVWHSPSDFPVKLSRMLPFHPWGNMGAVGYKGEPDDRVRNYNEESGFDVSSRHHSETFSTEKLPYFGPMITSLALMGLDDGHC